MKTICVFGLGYIGLPTASILALNGFKVFGYDTNPDILDHLSKGEVHIEEPGLQTVMNTALKSGNLQITSKPVVADIYLLAVPTPIKPDKTADLSYIKQAIHTIVPLLKKGDTVILESTSPPGTCQEFVRPSLEQSGLEVGKELFLAYCPERVLPGNTLNELIQNHRIIGGINRQSAIKVRKIYKTFVTGDILLTDATTAEMVKITENAYRDVNIALANELAKISQSLGINAWEVIQLANMHPRVHLHSPGPGVGGHCISVDPWFIVEKAPDLALLIHQARKINDSMPTWTLSLVLEKTKSIPQPKVTILGLSYKANIDDARESPSLKIMDLLSKESHIRLYAHDPHIKHCKYPLYSFDDAVKDSDCLILATDHDDFKAMDPTQIATMVRHKIIIDTRNTLNHEEWLKLGFDMTLLGKGMSSIQQSCWQ